jgi:N utilization substance protein A
MSTESNRMEMLQVADAVAREKGINREEVIEAMEFAIQKAGRTRYGHENDIRAYIDRGTGEISLARYREVVEELEPTFEATQISLQEAQEIDPNHNIGDFIKDPLPPIDFGRVAAQTARQVIIQKVREAERERQFGEFKERIGEIINGVVKRAEFGNVILDLGRAEGLMRREDVIPRENLKVGDRVRAYIMDVRRETNGAQIFLSRTHPRFMAELFKQEVPEIYDGAIEIKAVARDPGSRAKIAVTASDRTLDPVGACVGMRGSRVQAVVGELQGEKIDIILWSADVATFVVNALAPAEVTKVVVEEEENRIDVIVPEDQLSLAIGRRGQNVRLASQLTNLQIDIMTEATETERRAEVVNTRSKLFMEALDVDEIIAHLLVAEGFTSPEEIAYASLEELAAIEGFDEEVGRELQNRVKEYLVVEESKLNKCLKELEIADDLIQLAGLESNMLVKLGEKNIKTLDDFADLASDEVVEILGTYGIDIEKANSMIMAARAHWFEGEDKNPSLENSQNLKDSNKI